MTAGPNLSGSASIYDPGYVESLFDGMARTYDFVNYVSSFGFSERWRRQVVARAAIVPGSVVCELMCGQGECWESAARAFGTARLVALDLSVEMLRGARARTARYPRLKVNLSRQNALQTGFPDGFADSIFCAFGIKTLSKDQQSGLAEEIHRLLKPGGTFSVIEVSVPRGWIFERLYMYYLTKIIPIVGAVFLGDLRAYRMLGVYTARFGNCRNLHDALAGRGLAVAYHSYFFGCASGVSGAKP